MALVGRAAEQAEQQQRDQRDEEQPALLLVAAGEVAQRVAERHAREAARCPTACRCARAGTGTSAATGRTRARRSPSRRASGAPRRGAGRATPSTTSSTADHEQQVERPVLRVERAARRAAPNCASRPSVGDSSARRNARMPHDDEQHLERVHARLGRVADRVRVRRDQRSPRSTRRPGPRRGGRRTTVATDRADHAHARQRPRPRQSPEPNTARPDVQQHVVERRRAVVAQRVVEVAERQAGDVDRQRLVEPQVGAGPEEEHEPARRSTAATAIDGRPPRRVRSGPRRLRRLARGRVGEHGHGARR